MSSYGVSLQPFHTFHLALKAQQIIQANTAKSLRENWLSAKDRGLAVQLLGEGSNVLFTDDFAGLVLLNRIKGYECVETADTWYLRVGAGENWHQFVCQTLQNGIGGLENLALIPGCVGSAPIQNIGAYGIELESVCDYVDLVVLQTGQTLRVDAADCKFGYRDSLFKQDYREGYAITQVGFRLPKRWQPILTYGELKALSIDNIKPLDIFNRVCSIRRSKLPDPDQVGNAGSFFKNPLVSAIQAEKLLARFAQMPHYQQADGRVKLAAGWLIDHCGLKGYQQGGAAVHPQQALVLINQHQATSQDLIALARYVRQRVADQFTVWLEPEVRFIGPQGELDAAQVLL